MIPYEYVKGAANYLGYPPPNGWQFRFQKTGAFTPFDPQVFPDINAEALKHWNIDQQTTMNYDTYLPGFLSTSEVTTQTVGISSDIFDLTAQYGDEPYKSHAQKLVNDYVNISYTEANVSQWENIRRSASGDLTPRGGIATNSGSFSDLAFWSRANISNKNQGLKYTDFINPSRGTALNDYELGIIGNKENLYNPGAPILVVAQTGNQGMNEALANVGTGVGLFVAVVATAGLATGAFAGAGAAADATGTFAGAETVTDATVVSTEVGAVSVPATTSFLGAVESTAVGLGTTAIKSVAVGALANALIPKANVPSKNVIPLNSKQATAPQLMPLVNQTPQSSNNVGLILGAIALKLLFFA